MIHTESGIGIIKVCKILATSSKLTDPLRVIRTQSLSIAKLNWSFFPRAKQRWSWIICHFHQEVGGGSGSPDVGEVYTHTYNLLMTA